MARAGAWRDGERIRASPVDALDRALVVHSSVNFLRKSRYWDGFLRLADRTQVQRGLGDFSAYLWVAEGQAEIAFSTTVKAWDVAALKVLVEEAGGRSPTSTAETGSTARRSFAQQPPTPRRRAGRHARRPASPRRLARAH
jgi:histidinol-phosphatase